MQKTTRKTLPVVSPSHYCETAFIGELGTAAALVSTGQQLSNICRFKDGTISDFLFCDTDELSRVVELYEKGRLSLDAKQYFQAVQQVQDRITKMGSRDIEVV